MLNVVASHSMKKDDFNDNISQFRKLDNIEEYLEITFIELAKKLPNNIKYLGREVELHHAKNSEIQQGKTIKGRGVKKNEIVLNTKETYAKLVNYSFELTVEQNRGLQNVEQKCIQKFPIWIPLLYDDYHYKIRGNKYCAPLQIVDGLFYNNMGNVVILKTLSRAIPISRQSYNITDIYGNTYKTYRYFISIISGKESPFLLFFFGYLGFEATVRFFVGENVLELVDIKPDEIPNLPPNKLYFKFCKYYLAVDKNTFNSNIKCRWFIACCLSVSKRNMTFEDIRNNNKWLHQLGGQIVEYISINKGKSMINTLIESYDYNTKSLIAKSVKHGEILKNDIFSVMKWVFFDFNQITSKSAVDLSNKRIRLGEYMITPIVKYTTNKLFKFINKPKKSQDLKSLQDIFKLNSQIIINSIIGKTNTKSKDMNLSVAKYCEYVNDNAYLNAATSATHAGPGSAIEKSKKKNISLAHRRFNTSAAGCETLIETSNSDPGIGIHVVPTAKIDLETGLFMGLNSPIFNKNNSSNN